MKPQPAAVKWYSAGFALGASGGRATQRKGRPRFTAMLPHWKRGIFDGGFARAAFVGAYEQGERVGRTQKKP